MSLPLRNAGPDTNTDPIYCFSCGEEAGEGEDCEQCAEEASGSSWCSGCMREARWCACP